MRVREDRVTALIISCIIAVHRALGPGFLERVYLRALKVELELRGVSFEAEKRVEILYREHLVGAHRIDLIVANDVVVELKCVERLCTAHYAQLRSYLKATRLRVGLLVNFASEQADYRRIEPDTKIGIESNR